MAPVEYFLHKSIIFICPFLRVFWAFHSCQSFIYHLFYCPLHVCARLFLSSSSFSFMLFFCSMCLGVSNWTVICFYQQAKQNLGPGEYDLKSFLHELNGSYLKLFSSWNFSFFVYFDLVHFYCHVYFLSFSVLSDKHRNHHGAFLKVERFPAYPTNRVYCSTLSQYPRDPVSLLSDQVPPAKYKVNWELE